jgi:hypothetical protein
MDTISDIIEKKNKKISVSNDYIFKFLNKFRMNVNNDWVNFEEMENEILDRMPGKITYIEFLDFVISHCMTKSSHHPDYSKLGSMINTFRLHEFTYNNMAKVADILYNNYDDNNDHHPIVSKELYDIILKNEDKINEIIDYERDYDFDFFGTKTMERSYLLKIHYHKDNYQTH